MLKQLTKVAKQFEQSQGNLMKLQHIITLLLCTSLCMACRGKNGEAKQSDITVSDTTSYIVNNDFYDFGDITAGDIVGYTYTITNTGTHDMVIKNVKTGCACTTVEVEKTKVEPNESCKVDIEFNSSGRSGIQIKEIRIFANVIDEAIKLRFTANVNN